MSDSEKKVFSVFKDILLKIVYFVINYCAIKLQYAIESLENQQFTENVLQIALKSKCYRSYITGNDHTVVLLHANKWHHW